MRVDRGRHTRTQHGVGSLALAAFAILVVASCGGTSSSNFGSPSAVDASAPPSSSPGNLGGDATSCAQPAESCPCPQLGQTAACWTGPADKRNTGACHDGTVQCLKNGEFLVWGPCQGEQLDCGGTGGGGHEDAGGDGTGGGGHEDSGGDGTGGGGVEPCGSQNPGPACGCVPGAVIGCDEDCVANIYCTSDSEKTCLPDGTWGPCHETGNSTNRPLCAVYGYGCCTSSASSNGCNGGNGVYAGDCSYAFTCPVANPPNCSVQATVINGQAQVMCVCN